MNSDSRQTSWRKGYIYSLSLLLFVITISSMVAYYVSTSNKINAVYLQADTLDRLSNTEDDIAGDLQSVMGQKMNVWQEGDTLVVVFDDSTPFELSDRTAYYCNPYSAFINGTYALKKQANLSLDLPQLGSDCMYILTNGTADMCYIHEKSGTHDYITFYSTSDLVRVNITINLTCAGTASQINPPNEPGTLVTVNYKDESDSQTDTFGIKDSGVTKYQVKFGGSQKVEIEFSSATYEGQSANQVVIDAITDTNCNYTSEYRFSYSSSQQMSASYNAVLNYSQANVSKLGFVEMEQG